MSAYDYVGQYGQDWQSGILVDHLDRVLASGAPELLVRSDGTQAVLLFDADGTGDVFPVVCGDLIEVYTEDGPISGRCGRPVRSGAYACEGHAAARDEWLALSEIEKAAYERSLG